MNHIPVSKRFVDGAWELTAQAPGRQQVLTCLYQKKAPSRAQLEEVASAAQKAPHLKGGES